MRGRGAGVVGEWGSIKRGSEEEESGAGLDYERDLEKLPIGVVRNCQ